MNLEKMGEFFDNRLDSYDEHMMTNIESAREFYRFTAAHLPKMPNSNILDLGCGTGLELEEYFKLNPSAMVTGIDIAPGMLGALTEKFTDKNITLILGSYFDVQLREECFDAAVSVESLHHYTKEEKLPLYSKVCRSLKAGGCFILTDYFAHSDEEEGKFRDELLQLKREQHINDDELYHFDTPLTTEHEIEALSEAGFSKIEVLRAWGATHIIRAEK